MKQKTATVGERIKAIRGEMSQAEFGALLDSSQGAVSAWERDDKDRSPSAAIYFRLAALARDAEEAVFFLQQATLQPDAVVSVADMLLKKGEVKMDAILATAEDKLKERMGDEKQLEDEGKVVFVTPFVEGEWKAQASALPVTMPANRVPNKASTYFVVARPPGQWDVGGRGFVPGETVVFDAREASAQRVERFLGQEVLFDFEKGGPPHGLGGLLIGQADIRSEAGVTHLVLGRSDVLKSNWKLDETYTLTSFQPAHYMPAELRERPLPRHPQSHHDEWQRAYRVAESEAIARLRFPEGCRVLGRVIARFSPEPAKA